MDERAGIDVDVIIGARTKDIMILENEMRELQEIFILQQMTVLTVSREMRVTR